MRLLIKPMIMLAGFSLAVAEVEADYPVGFKPKEYVYVPNIKEPSAPSRVRRFELPEQGYVNCLPVSMKPGAYAASNHTMNTAEQIEVKVLRVSVVNTDESSPDAMDVFDIIEGHLDREPIKEWDNSGAEQDKGRTADWDGTTALALPGGVEKMPASADNSAPESSFDAVGYRYVYNANNSRFFIEMGGNELTCNETLNQFEWDTIDPVLSWPSKGYLKLSYVDGQFMAIGTVRRYYSFLGLTLGSYGGYTEFSFDVQPLVGEKINRKDSRNSR